MRPTFVHIKIGNFGAVINPFRWDKPARFGASIVFGPFHLWYAKVRI